MHNWIALSAETPGVLRDECGVPVEWTLLREGENPICQEGLDGSLRLSAEAMKEIMAYHEKKGEQIPVDSEHYLYELANSKKVDESEALKLFPGGVAALGFGRLALSGEELQLTDNKLNAVMLDGHVVTITNKHLPFLDQWRASELYYSYFWFPVKGNRDW